MASKKLARRLEALRQALMSGHSGGVDVSSHSVGKDRELFINLILSNIISVPFRTGTGEIIDADDHISAQCDIVVEYANTLSFPNIYPSSARLYLAESVCAVIEVKSNLSSQWREVVDSATKLSKLERECGPIFDINPPPSKIPLFAVAYTGWQNSSTAREKLVAANEQGTVISGVLQIEPSFFLSAIEHKGMLVEHKTYEGVGGIYGFLLQIESLTSDMVATKPLFARYIE